MATFHINALKRINFLENFLKYSQGLAMIVVGLDKFFNITVRWEAYLHPRLGEMLTSVFGTHPMYPVGVIEIIIGIIILSPYTRIGAYLEAAWFMIIILNLLATGTYMDIVLRDVLIMGGAIALGQLVTLCEELKNHMRREGESIPEKYQENNKNNR